METTLIHIKMIGNFQVDSGFFKAASLFVSFTATVWTRHTVEGEFFVCQV